MSKILSMADLLAQEGNLRVILTRGQEVEGEVVAILPQEIVLDLGAKSEGVLQKKDLSPEQAANLKVGDKLITFVIHPENESGQVVLGLQRAVFKGNVSPAWKKFELAMKGNQSLKGRGIEVNRGGLIIEVDGVRGFLPTSQVGLQHAANIEELIGKDLEVTVIESDPNQNRLIFSQKANVSEDTKKKLSQLKVGDKVSGAVAAVLPFGVFVTLENDIEGLVHISEISWEKTEDPNSFYKVGDVIEAKVIAADSNTGRVNLSVKQLSQDPFSEKVKDIQPDDVVKVVVAKVSAQGISFSLPNYGDIEGFMPIAKADGDAKYEEGESMTCLVDSVDTQKRRVNLVPFVTSTKDLIYK